LLQPLRGVAMAGGREGRRRKKRKCAFSLHSERIPNTESDNPDHDVMIMKNFASSNSTLNVTRSSPGLIDTSICLLHSDVHTEQVNDGRQLRFAINTRSMRRPRAEAARCIGGSSGDGMKVFRTNYGDLSLLPTRSSSAPASFSGHPVRQRCYPKFL
jgi:hypothetical protein